MTSGDERSESPDEASGERSEPSEKSSEERSEGERSEPSEQSIGDERSAEPRDNDSRDSEDRPEGDPRETRAATDGSRERSGDERSESRDGSILTEYDVSEPGADDGEVEPVELLVQMAEDGEIDPWDIDVVTVTDAFLARLDESDLRTGGRALFYASVLLRMKSDALWTDEPEDEEWQEPEPWGTEGDLGDAGGEPAVDPFDELEREMDRRIDRKRARGMPETLDELVRDLRERERDTWWKESRTYDTSNSPSGYARGTQTLDYHTGDDLRMDDEPTAHDVTGTAHGEHMEDIINEVYVALQSHYEQGRDEVLFAEVREAAGSVVNTFLGVLFLSHRGQVRLQQDELFGDLWVQDPAAVPVEEPVTADD